MLLGWEQVMLVCFSLTAVFKAAFAQYSLEQGEFRLAFCGFSAISWNIKCVCVGGRHWYLTVRLPWWFWRTGLRGVQNLCVMSHLCSQFCAEYSLPKRHELLLSLSNWKNFIKLKDGAYLKYIFCMHPSLLFFPSQGTARTSSSSVKLISMKTTYVSILDAFVLCPNTPAFSVFAETAYECCKCICWSQWDLCCHPYLNWWMF